MTTRKRKAEAAPPEDTPWSPWAELEDRLEYRFRRPELLELALTHRSFPYEGGQTATTLAIQQVHGWREPRNAPGTDNEQLEFLGDAVLGILVTEALFAEFKQCGEGDLTRLRASLVSRKRMAEMGEQLDLGRHLLLGRSAELNGIRKKPTVLANAAEAVLAAIYLDAREQAARDPASEHAATAGFGPVRRLVERYLLGPERENLHRELELSGEGRALRDHKTLLQERVQAAGSGKLKYVDAGESGPAHQKKFAVEAHLETDDGVRVLASAEGPSKKEAQQRAAALALEVLGVA